MKVVWVKFCGGRVGSDVVVGVGGAKVWEGSARGELDPRMQEAGAP